VISYAEITNLPVRFQIQYPKSKEFPYTKTVCGFKSELRNTQYYFNLFAAATVIPQSKSEFFLSIIGTSWIWLGTKFLTYSIR